jgi:hypothetical protein
MRHEELMCAVVDLGGGEQEACEGGGENNKNSKRGGGENTKNNKEEEVKCAHTHTHTHTQCEYNEKRVE